MMDMREERSGRSSRSDAPPGERLASPRATPDPDRPDRPALAPGGCGDLAAPARGPGPWSPPRADQPGTAPEPAAGIVGTLLIHAQGRDGAGSGAGRVRGEAVPVRARIFRDLLDPSGREARPVPRTRRSGADDVAGARERAASPTVRPRVAQHQATAGISRPRSEGRCGSFRLPAGHPRCSWTATRSRSWERA